MRPTATPDGNGACAHRRREDLDLQRRHRRPLRRLRPHRRGARREGPLGLRGRCRHAGPDDRRAHRGDRAASAGDAALRRLPRAGRRTASAAPGEGFKVAMATLDIFRSTVGAAALGFARRALDEALEHARDAQAVRRAARRAPADAGGARRHGDRGRRRGAAGLPRRLDQGHAAPRASRAKRRWRSCTRPRPRSA